MDIIIPQVSAVGVCIVTVCILTSALKSIISFKPIYVWLPLVFSLPLGFMVALAESGWILALISNTMIKTFSICAGSMASYDIVSKTLKGWKKNIEDDGADNESNSPNTKE